MMKPRLDFAFTALLTFGFAVVLFHGARAQAASSPACAVLQIQDAVSVDRCDLSTQSHVIRVHFKRVKGLDLALLAEFDNHAPASRRVQIWKKFWSEGAAAKLTSADQKTLRQILDNPTRALRLSAAPGLLKILVEMVEPGQAIENFNPRSRAALEDTEQEPQEWTMICEFIGKQKDATYSVAEQSFNVIADVGIPDSRCRGRCGLGCWELESESNIYTQECLNHDMCRDATGSQFGECADEFWTASSGYLYATSCVDPSQQSLITPAHRR